jgi:hypothetical protein
MWFMAPYGSWVYAGFVKDNAAYFRKINIGSADPNYEMITWDFGLAANTPETIFPYEQHEGGPTGAMGCGCIRGATPTLYVAGRGNAAPAVNTVVHRFPVGDDFEQDPPGTIPWVSGSPISINDVAGLEVDQGNAYYVVLNNNDHGAGDTEFKLYRYAYTWDGAGHEYTHAVNLSTNYMENNTNSRIRGVALASDGNVIVFVNTGVTSTECKVIKFDKDTLAYMGQTTWTPNISTVIWGYIVKANEVFMLFQGLDSNSVYDWKTSVYYDRATGIPDAAKSNFIIENNLTTFGSDDPIALVYKARDAFNIPVVGAATEFAINGEDPDDPSTWTDRLGAIRENTGDDFFDVDNVPIAISAVDDTDGDGLATVYYKPMRTGSGTEIDAIDVYCPSS